MKLFSYLKPPLIFTLLLVFILLGFIGFSKIGKLSDEKPALTIDQINKVKSNLKTFSSNPHLSNPLAHVEGYEKEYDEIVQMGEPVVDYFIGEFRKGNLDGSNEWLTAWINIINDAQRDMKYIFVAEDELYTNHQVTLVV